MDPTVTSDHSDNKPATPEEWRTSRSGARAARGFDYQHLVSTLILVRQWACAAPPGHLVPVVLTTASLSPPTPPSGSKRSPAKKACSARVKSTDSFKPPLRRPPGYPMAARAVPTYLWTSLGTGRHDAAAVVGVGPGTSGRQPEPTVAPRSPRPAGTMALRRGNARRTALNAARHG